MVTVLWRRFFAAWRATSRRRRAWLSIAATMALYGFCGVWLWDRSHWLRAVVALPWGAVALALGCGVFVIAGVKPFRHKLLLAAFGVRSGYGEGLRDRAVMAALKTFLPWALGDPASYVNLGRRHGLEPAAISKLWLLDKWLTLLATGALAMMALLWSLVPHWLAILCSGMAMAWLWLPGILGLDALRPWARATLTGLALVQELLQMVGLAVLLGAVLDGGPGAIRWWDVVLVHGAAMLPLWLGGAGSREAATLVLFAGMADDGALFVAAFAATLLLRVAPALPGLVLFGLTNERGHTHA